MLQYIRHVNVKHGPTALCVCVCVCEISAATQYFIKESQAAAAALMMWL